LTDTLAVNTKGGAVVSALNTVTLRGESYAFGDVTAASMSAEKGVYFNTPPAVSTDFLTKSLATEHVHSRYPDLTFGYAVASLDGVIYASLDMAVDVTLNVYVPTFVYIYPDAFTVISVDGIVYAPPVTSGRTVTVDGEEYVKFTYSQIHASDINEELCIRLSVGGYEHSTRIPLRDLFLKSISESDSDSFRRLAATYLNYAFEAVNYTPDDDTLALITPYVTVPDVPVTAATEILRTVYFNAQKEIVQIYPADGIQIFAIRTNWNGKSMYLRFDDGNVEFPYLRFDPSATFTVYYLRDGKTCTVEMDILSLYALISDSAGHSSRLFEMYLSYLVLYKSLA
ncbi:MAG: hypothetical protein IKV43_06415, partial [Clostridia bacterium]|nr:hypothetical protein [Clostridia bacterium]